MKALKSLFFVSMLVVFSGVSVAAEINIAVVDISRAMMMTDLFREEVKTLEGQKEYSETMAKIEGLQEQLKKMMEEEQKEGPTWSNEQVMEFRKNGEFMQKDLELAAQKIQAENQVVKARIEKTLAPIIKEVLDQIIKAERIAILLDKRSAIFANSTVDLTDKLVEKLNAETGSAKK